MCDSGAGGGGDDHCDGLMCECVSWGYRVNPQISHSGVSCKQRTMAKRTISSYVLPKPNDVEKTNPENESDSDCEETAVAKKGRNINFRDEWLREFTWLRYFRETNSQKNTTRLSNTTSETKNVPRPVQ